MITHSEIRTKRLFLRTLTEADAQIVRDTERHFANVFETEHDGLQWIRWANGRSDVCYNFYIWLAQTNEVIGHVYFHSKDDLGGAVEIAYGILEAYRCQHYATEAAKSVVSFAFEQAGLDALVAIVKPDNIASRRVIEKLGFQKDGVLTVPDENGEDCAFDHFQLKRGDWQLHSR